MSHNIDYSHAPVAEVEAEIGRRLMAARLAASVSQAELAAEAGVSRRTITRIEHGHGASLDTLIRILRALGLAGRLDALLAEPGVSPIDRVRRKGKPRQRVRATTRTETADWSWADETDTDR